MAIANDPGESEAHRRLKEQTFLWAMIAVSVVAQWKFVLHDRGSESMSRRCAWTAWKKRSRMIAVFECKQSR